MSQIPGALAVPRAAPDRNPGLELVRITEAPMLDNGERVADGTGADCDVAVDPIDGTRLTALGMSNAISVTGGAERGSMDDPSAVFSVDELATGPAATEVVDIRLPVKGTGIDLMLGIGGTPEGIIAACALKGLGGVIQGRLAPTDDAERRKAEEAGLDLDAVLTTATGGTAGELLKGVRYGGEVVRTQSPVMRSTSGTIGVIDSDHLSTLRAYASVDFDHAC